MTPGQIQGALKDLKPPVTQKELAAELGCSEIAISNVINQKMVSDLIMKAIAAKLSKERWEVFDYYLRHPRRSTSKTLRKYGTQPRSGPDSGASQKAA
jgi:hypothetical protein